MFVLSLLFFLPNKVAIVVVAVSKTLARQCRPTETLCILLLLMIRADATTVGGGVLNTAKGHYSAIGSGYSNRAFGSVLLVGLCCYFVLRKLCCFLCV